MAEHSFEYILDGHTPVPAPDRETWARSLQDADGRRVAETTLADGTWISTVFLGIDHAFLNGPPLLFETMVFPSHDVLRELDCERCSTWEEAEAQHAAMVEKWSAMTEEH